MFVKQKVAEKPVEKKESVNPLAEKRPVFLFQYQEPKEVPKPAEKAKEKEPEKIEKVPAKPMIDTDDESELKGWHDDSQPAQENAQPKPSIKEPSKEASKEVPKPSSKNAPMFEEEHNELMGWDKPHQQEVSYVPAKSNPLLGNPLVGGKGLGNRESQKERTKEVQKSSNETKKKNYELEEDLSGWNN